MAILKLDGVSKRYGPVQAVDALSLEVGKGEFVALLGPSGCGKTTLLRLLAGFERPDSGSIEIDGVVVADAGYSVPPENRTIGMVFQSYALWPHLTVHGNIAFGLKVRRLGKKDIERRISGSLRLVGLEGFENRRTDQLSGGQRQRVALARCLALEPSIVLLDEPLANLDAHLRDSMRTELRRIQQETSATFMFVTHDQTEALSLADRIAVMDHGRILQIAPPTELYSSPGSPMVASFIGRGIVLKGNVTKAVAGDTHDVELWGRRVPARSSGLFQERACEICIRPHDLEILREDAADAYPGTVGWVSYQGRAYIVGVHPESDPALELRIEAPGAPPHAGDSVRFRVCDSWVLPPRGTRDGNSGIAVR